MNFSLVTLNIEGRKHLERITPFLLEQRPDVITLQEVHEDTSEALASQLGYGYRFAKRLDIVDDPSPQGCAVITHFPIQSHKLDYYEQFTHRMPEAPPYVIGRPNCPVLSTVLDIEGQPVTVATTHYTWAPGGMVSEEQLVNYRALESILDTFPEIIFTGDFNSPRGTEIYDALAQRFGDNIPRSITSTVDPNLHKAGRLEYVVDGIFATANYAVTDVAVVDSLSDHCAITAIIQ